ncbi:MAG: hypothetical protein CVT49_03480 [candidate division Zixibacteria bacterium HGW-Zixibacteria-1]|nr:MAG: hypothetical protein CVT49_03480 [candidate division Zixibacteria bacterium HGW-Zixibacteria-1]
MKGIKKHTHEDREKAILEMVPLIRKKFGDNLVPLAVCCSFARNEDADYSDLELTAFVKTMPEGEPQDGFAKIFDGMLVELTWMTRETYLKTTLDVNEDWYLSGSDRMLPLINDEFIAELNAYRPPDLKQKCLDRAVGCFAEYQETVSKVLNAVNQENCEGIPVLFFEMIMQTLKLLSFLNQKPYVTASRMISQAREFQTKPKSIERLFDLAVNGRYQDLTALQNITIAVFEEFEIIFESLGLVLYDDNIDPNKPVHKMRRMQKSDE